MTSASVYFSPLEIQVLASFINNAERPKEDGEDAEQLRKRIAELEAENAELRNKETPANSALLLIARALELYQDGKPERNTQTTYVAAVREKHEAVRGLSERTLNGLLSKANTALSDARSDAKRE